MATSGEAGPPVAKKARLAAGTACELCRRRKQRCDGKRPACSNCLSRETGTWCQYSSDGGEKAGAFEGPVGPLNTTPRTTTPRTPIDLPAPARIGERSPGDQAFYGDSSTISFVSNLDATNPLERNRRPSTLHRQRAEPCALGLSLSSEPLSKIPDGAPPQELADRLIDAYFERVHIFYPCLHEPSFRAEWDGYQASEGSLDASTDDRSWLAVLNMIFAHGTQFVVSHADTQDRPFLDADKFALDARRFAITALSKVTTLETVQALLLLSHYLQGTTELDDCWNVGGVLIRSAMSIGLHIDPSGSNLSEVEKQVRKRVWAGCFIIDRTLSMKYGRPSAIPIAIVQRVQKPATVDDQYITSSTNRPRQPLNRPSKMDFFVNTIDQAYIIDAVLDDLYLDDSGLQMLRDQAGYPRTEVLSGLLSKALRLDGRLQAWWEGLPQHLREGPEEADGVDFVRQRCVISLR